MIEIKANEIKSVKVSKEFQEVGIEYLRDEDIATMSVTDNTMVTKIKRLCSEAPDAYKCYVGSYNPDTGEPDSYIVKFPKNLLSFRKPSNRPKRQLTEEQRKAVGERFRKKHDTTRSKND